VETDSQQNCRSRNVEERSRLSTKGKQTMARYGRHYQIVYGSGSDCEWSEILEILCELNNLHDDRLRRIDEAGGGPEIRARFELSSVLDLQEVNALLAQIVGQLEQEATGHV
jgi:hypothetical protein